MPEVPDLSPVDSGAIRMSNIIADRSRSRSRSRTKSAGQQVRSRRRYQPDLESLEAIEVLSAAVPGLSESALTERILVPEPTWSQNTSDESLHAILEESRGGISSSVSPLFDAWDAAIAEAADRSDDHGTSLADAYSESLTQVGYNRMERYLNRAWQKAGIAPPQDEDCTQSVYMVLLERWGRDQFEGLATYVGRSGLNTLISRDSPVGLDFLRALDQIKKQTQRQMSRKTILMDDSASLSASRQMIGAEQVVMSRDLEQVIQDTLKPREAELIRSTIQGDSPSEIAARWGVTPKTVSNVKSEAIQKLKVTLADSLDIDFQGQSL